MEQSEKLQRRRCFNLPVQLLQDDLFHSHHVGHGEAILTDSDQIVRQRNVILLLGELHSDVEAAESNTCQVLRLDLKGQDQSDETRTRSCRTKVDRVIQQPGLTRLVSDPNVKSQD